MSNTAIKTVILHVDYGDMLLMAREEGVTYGRDRIARLMGQAASSGVTHIYWRVSMIGVSNYPSRIRYQLHDRGAQNLSLNEPSPHPFSLIGDVYQQVLREGDPLAIASEEAHAHGLSFYLYVTLFDESYPGLESRFVQDHPHCCWQHRYFPEKRIPGLLSYAYPEVVDYRLAELQELLTYEVDGIYLDAARTHCGVWDISAVPFASSSPYLSYGFNDPEVQEYQRRYGINPRLVNLADAVLPEQRELLENGTWDRLRGEYLTRFLAKASSLVRASKINLAAGVYTDADSYLSPAGQRGRVPLGRFHLDWETWAEQRLIDELVLVAGDHRRFGADDWKDHSAAQFAAARRQGLRVYLWAGTEHRIDELPRPATVALPLRIETDRDCFLEEMERALRVCYRLDADGVFLHEAWDIEKHSYFDVLRRAFVSSGPAEEPIA